MYACVPACIYISVERLAQVTYTIAIQLYVSAFGQSKFEPASTLRFDGMDLRR